MRPRTKGQGGAGIAGDVELFGVFEMGFIAVGRTEHEKHPFFGGKGDAAGGIRAGHAARGHADRGNPAGIFGKGLLPGGRAVLYHFQGLGMGQQGPGGAGNGVARFVLPPGNRQLDIGAGGLWRQAGLHLHRKQRKIGAGLF